MMCRVIAPLAAIFSREPASRPPLPRPGGPIQRRLRIARHRALRWFHVPIAVTERERRDRDLGPSLWSHALAPASALRLHAYDARSRGSATHLLH